MKGTVSQRGQVVIPKALRDQLGLLPGAILDFQEDHGKLVATKVVERDPVDRVYGTLKAAKSTDAMLVDLRGRAR